MELRRSTRLRRANYDPAHPPYISKEDGSQHITQQIPPPLFHSVSTIPETPLHNERITVGGNIAAMKDNAYMPSPSEKRSMPLQALSLIKHPKYSFKQPRPSYRSRLSDMSEDRIAIISHQLSVWCENHGQKSQAKEGDKDGANNIDYEICRSAEDMVVLHAIVEQLHRLKDSISKVQEDYDPEKLLASIKANSELSYSESDEKLVRLVDTHRNSPDEDWIKALADFHQINLQDIADVINVRHMKKNSTGMSQYNHQSSRKADMQYLSNKWNKLLTRERNIALYWPNKNSHKKTSAYNKSSNGSIYPETTAVPFSKSGQSQSTIHEDPKDKFTGVTLLY